MGRDVNSRGCSPQVLCGIACVTALGQLSGHESMGFLRLDFSDTDVGLWCMVYGHPTLRNSYNEYHIYIYI